jgi:hypothetical protein
MAHNPKQFDDLLQAIRNRELKTKKIKKLFDGKHLRLSNLGLNDDDFSNLISALNDGQYLHSIQSINLAGNQLTSAEFSDEMVSLEAIRIYSNALENLVISYKLRNLRVIDARHNRLTDFVLQPSWREITTLLLDHNFLTEQELPNTYTKLDRYSVKHNRLSSILAPLSLVAISHLDISNNPLNIATILNFLALKTLLASTAITSIPRTIISSKQIMHAILSDYFTALYTLKLKDHFKANKAIKYVRNSIIPTLLPVAPIVSIITQFLLPKLNLDTDGYIECMQNGIQAETHLKESTRARIIKRLELHKPLARQTITTMRNTVISRLENAAEDIGPKLFAFNKFIEANGFDAQDLTKPNEQGKLFLQLVQDLPATDANDSSTCANDDIKARAAHIKLKL